MFYVLILTIVTNYSSPAVVKVDFKTKEDCEYAGLQHKNAVVSADVRSTVIYTCSPNKN